MRAIMTFVIYCNTLQHTATHCAPSDATNLHSVARVRTIETSVTHCNTLQHAATRCDTLRTVEYHELALCRPRAHHSDFYNTLQHTSTPCNTLHHAATPCAPSNVTNLHSVARMCSKVTFKSRACQTAVCREPRARAHCACVLYVLGLPVI